MKRTNGAESFSALPMNQPWKIKDKDGLFDKKRKSRYYMTWATLLDEWKPKTRKEAWKVLMSHHQQLDDSRAYRANFISESSYVSAKVAINDHDFS
jgi:hypothetical protein